jgi:hypothetical protein
VILVLVVSVWVIVLIAFIVLSAALRGTSIRAGTKARPQQVKTELINEQLEAG